MRRLSNRKSTLYIVRRRMLGHVIEVTIAVLHCGLIGRDRLSQRRIPCSHHSVAASPLSLGTLIAACIWVTAIGDSNGTVQLPWQRDIVALLCLHACCCVWNCTSRANTRSAKYLCTRFFGHVFAFCAFLKLFLVYIGRAYNMAALFYGQFSDAISPVRIVGRLKMRDLTSRDLFHCANRSSIQINICCREYYMSCASVVCV